MKARVLCEAEEFKRSPPEKIYGTQTNITIFKESLKERYTEETLTTFSTKRVTLKTLKTIVVHGEIPQIRQITQEQLTEFKENVPLAAVLVQKWGYGYFHFLVEVLPKVLRMNELNKRIPILIDFNTIFIKQVLEYFQITNSIVTYNNNSMFFPVKEAVHITETMSGNPTPSDIAVIRGHLSHIIKSLTLPKVNILIYRKGQQRSITNFDQLLIQLKALTPSDEWVVFDQLPFVETVELFSRAKMIVGAHGAGLTNMIFAPKHIPIIELCPLSLVNLCYWHLSWILENDHRLFACEASEGYEIKAPIDDLINVIKTIN
jgi:hypothetical protein